MTRIVATALVVLVTGCTLSPVSEFLGATPDTVVAMDGGTNQEAGAE